MWFPLEFLSSFESSLFLLLACLPVVVLCVFVLFSVLSPLYTAALHPLHLFTGLLLCMNFCLLLAISWATQVLFRKHLSVPMCWSGLLPSLWQQQSIRSYMKGFCLFYVHVHKGCEIRVCFCHSMHRCSVLPVLSVQEALVKHSCQKWGGCSCVYLHPGLLF